MREHKRQAKAQSTFDYLVLTGVVLIVIIPLLFISTGKLASLGESQLTESIQSLKGGIISVNSLGYGATNQVIIRIPKGIEEAVVSGNFIYFTINGEKVDIRVPAQVAGYLPIEEGLHHVNIFNNGSHVIFFKCGNNITEVTEQCDTDDDALCKPSLGCVQPGHPGQCNCACEINDDCATKNCIKKPSETKGYCAPCSTDKQCGPGNKCVLGVCKPDPCAKCSASEICCGSACCNATTEYCDKNVCKPIPKCSKPEDCLTYGKRTCVGGKCLPCTLDSQCKPADKCDTRTGECKPKIPRFPPQCMNGKIEGNETCEFNTTSKSLIAPCKAPLVCHPDHCVCVPRGRDYCGDGKVQKPEYCDDGLNNGRYIGPSSSCGVGPRSAPLVCTKGCACQYAGDFCGDGRLSPIPGREQCDPGNGTIWGGNSTLPGNYSYNLTNSTNRSKMTSGVPCALPYEYCTHWCTCRPKFPGKENGYCGDGKYRPGFEECDPSAGVFCPWGMKCLADCSCQGRGPPPIPGPGGGPGPGAPGPASPGGNPKKGCREIPVCEDVYTCAGDCKDPKEECLDFGDAGCDCGEKKECDGFPELSCREDADCGPNRYCGTNNCCAPTTPRNRCAPSKPCKSDSECTPGYCRKDGCCSGTSTRTTSDSSSSSRPD